ncbi:heavy metal translocating P-type ATPase [Halopenitus salinus]|uniref:Heavy metal translocating P-type ATPase n=1 Tax=Halopenitus salinus TaxID=1198295 RepID=A0ABD5UYL3_9EURY
MSCSLCDLPTPAEPVTDPDVDGEFCCRGCLEVARSLGGLEELEDAAANVDADVSAGGGGAGEDGGDADLETTYLHVDGMHCATCERFLELTAGRAEGVEAATASYATDTVRVDYDPERIDSNDLEEVLSTAGYHATDRADRSETGDDVDVVRFLVGGGLFGMMAMLWYVLFLYPTYFGYDPLFELGGVSGRYLFAQIWVFASIVLFYTGFPILRGAYVSLRAGRPNMDLLVSLAAAGSYGYSTLALFLGQTDLYFDVTIAVVLVVTAGGQYETRIKRRATGLLSDLTTAMDETARLASGEEVTVSEIAPGQRLRVRPGERIPLDGTVVEGVAAVDESLVTGESIPETKRPGDAVRGGTIVADAPLVVAVGEDAESTLDRLVELLWDVQSSRSGAQRLADRLATVFVPLVAATALAVGAVRLATGSSPTAAALVALTVLIVSCPCAFGLATPLAVAAGIREAAERGIVVASDALFEEATSVDAVVLDKTGTLTDGEMRVLDVETAEGTTADRLLRRAVELERASPHPIAEAIVEGADRLRSDGGLSDREPSGVESLDDVDEPREGPSSGRDRPDRPETTVHDRGVVASIDGVERRVGHPSLFDDWAVPDRLADAADSVRTRGNVPVLVGWDGSARGVIAVGDDVRDGWEAFVSDLRDRGMEVVVLTGDSPESAARFEEHPNVDRVFAGVPPEAKAATVSRLAADRSVAMVGDGSNDAPALAAATVGIAVASGTDLALDAADAIVLEDRLGAVTELFDLAAGTGRRIRTNLGWALVYNAVAIPLAVAGLLNPLLAAVAMGASSLLVVANSARSILSTG